MKFNGDFGSNKFLYRKNLYSRNRSVAIPQNFRIRASSITRQSFASLKNFSQQGSSITHDGCYSSQKRLYGSRSQKLVKSLLPNVFYSR